MTRDEMTKWVFQQILEGLCHGKPLYSIANSIVLGVLNMTHSNLKKD